MTTAVPMRSPKRMPQPVRSRLSKNGVRMCRNVLTTLTRPMVMPVPKIIGRNFILRRSDQMNSSSIGQPTIISLVRGRMTSVFSRKLRNASSVLEVVDVLREAGAEVLGVASIFTYGMQKGLDRLAAANVINHSLSNFDTLCEVAAEEGYIKPEDIARLKKFRQNPSDESWMNG